MNRQKLIPKTGKTKNMVKHAIVFSLILQLWALPAFADHHGKKDSRPSVGAGPPVQSNLVPRTRTRISNKGAAALVKQRYSQSRILGVSVLNNNSPTVYRVKTLSESGVVRSIFVDGDSGEVFE